MKLLNARTEFLTEGDIDALAARFAEGLAHEPQLITEIQSSVLQDRLPGAIPDDVCVDMVEGAGFRLFLDDGSPASREVVVSLGQKVWDRLLDMAQMGMEEEDEDAQSWL